MTRQVLGYPGIQFILQSQHYNRLTHILGYRNHIGPIPPESTVNHWDGDKTNSNIGNLHLLSLYENQIHALTVELLDVKHDVPVQVSGDEPSASALLKDLAAQANRKIVCAPDGLLLAVPDSEPVVEPDRAEDEAGFEDRTVQALDAQQPARPPRPRTTRGDIHPSREPAFPRKYKTLASIFFNGSVEGQILSVYRTRIVNPAKVLDYKNALAAGDVTFGVKPLKKSLMAKLVEMGYRSRSGINEASDRAAKQPPGLSF
jgi:hypothetical protein